MWLIPYTPGENHLLTVTLKQPMEITGLHVWNYNKSSESADRGVRISYFITRQLCADIHDIFQKRLIAMSKHEKVIKDSLTSSVLISNIKN